MSKFADIPLEELLDDLKHNERDILMCQLMLAGQYTSVVSPRWVLAECQRVSDVIRTELTDRGIEIPTFDFCSNPHQ